jgi:hypothetical protein
MRGDDLEADPAAVANAAPGFAVEQREALLDFCDFAAIRAAADADRGARHDRSCDMTDRATPRGMGDVRWLPSPDGR